MEMYLCRTHAIAFNFTFNEETVAFTRDQVYFNDTIQYIPVPKIRVSGLGKFSGSVSYFSGYFPKPDSAEPDYQSGWLMEIGGKGRAVFRRRVG